VAKPQDRDSLARAQGASQRTAAIVAGLESAMQRAAARARPERRQGLLGRIAEARAFLAWAQETAEAGLLLNEIDEEIKGVDRALGDSAVREFWWRYLAARAAVLRGDMPPPPPLVREGDPR
jgi:hypothetical protein